MVEARGLLVQVLEPLKSFLLRVVHNLGYHFTAAFKNPENEGFVLSARAGDALRSRRLVHVASFAADEGSSASIRPDKLLLEVPVLSASRIL